jgi:hypothetical protein
MADERDNETRPADDIDRDPKADAGTKERRDTPSPEQARASVEVEDRFEATDN